MRSAPMRSARMRTAPSRFAPLRFALRRSALLTIDGPHIRLAQPDRRLHQRIQHHLEIKRRAADDLEHVGGGCLLLQRLT